MDSIPHAFDAGNQGSSIVTASIIVTVFATIAVGLRIISRRMLRLSLEADDYSILIALPFGWAMCICTLISVKYGLGKHIGTIRPHDLAIEEQSCLASELLWAASLTIIKISILLLYTRIFGHLRYFRLLAYIIGIFSICWGIIVILVFSFQCRPIQFLWDKSIRGTCIDMTLFFILGSALNVLTDFFLLVLPLPAVWNLHTTRAQKISLTAVFLLGSLTCVISLVRLVQLITNADMDVTWSFSTVAIWTVAEPNLGIVSACLPTMKPLLRRFLSQSKTRNAKSSKYSGNSSTKQYPSATKSFGSSGLNKPKAARGYFRELENNDIDRVPGLSGLQTYISSDEMGKEHSEIGMHVIEVKTSLDWQNEPRNNV